MDLGLEGKVCVVTGASRGIGRAAASMLAEEGARVLSVSRGGEGEGAVARDVTDPDAPERLLDACGDAPWALVNNAGVTRARPLEPATTSISPTNVATQKVRSYVSRSPARFASRRATAVMRPNRERSPPETIAASARIVATGNEKSPPWI